MQMKLKRLIVLLYGEGIMLADNGLNELKSCNPEEEPDTSLMSSTEAKIACLEKENKEMNQTIAELEESLNEIRNILMFNAIE